MSNRKIFISRCTPFTPTQTEFIEKLKQLILSRDWVPVIIGDTVEEIRTAAEQARDDSERFQKRFASWVRFVETRQDARKINLEKMTLKELIGTLTPKQFWGIGVAIGSLLAAVFAVGMKFG